MGIERSFTFAFKAPGGLSKIVVGGLFSLLFFTVFFPFVVMGYLMRVLCEALEGRDARLPSWELGPLFNEGLFPVLIMLVYASPVIAIMVANQLVVQWFGMNLAVIVPLMLLEIVMGIVVAMLVPLALIRFAIKRSMKAAFDFGKLIAFIGKNKGPYFTAWGLSLAVGAVVGVVVFVVAAIAFFATWAASDLLTASSVTAVAMAVTAIFLSFPSSLVPMHLYANAYRASTPFDDDKQGALRASMAIPPPLRER
jgi:hypothetical protein